MNDDLTPLSLARAAELIHAKKISARELTDAYLARIEHFNPRVNAYLSVSAETARQEARRADDELARGIYRGPLHGIPLAVKDLFDARGLRTTAGSKILRDNLATRDAFVVERLRDAGALLLGKLNLHEFAYGVTNENPHYGNVHNPWQLDSIPGGSSGGSAAAIAARLALGTLGSDTGGSIRIPSALCGTTGLKPTFGRVSLRGVIPLSWSNDHAGPIARDARDGALLLNAIAGYDRDDPASVNVESDDFGAPRENLRGLRIVLARGYFADKVDGEILNAVEAAARLLRECGAIVREAEIPNAAEIFATNRVILRVEATAYHREWLNTRAADYGADVLARLRNGETIRADEYARARRNQVVYRRALENFFADTDLILTPTTRIAAPRAGSLDPVTLAEHLTAFTAPFNVTGLPALSLPCGFTRAGLPIGMQLIARPWDELTILQTAQVYQTRSDWHTRSPNLD